MVKNKAIKNVFKEVAKNTVKEVVKDSEEVSEKKRLAGLSEKRNRLINEIKPSLMSNGALKRGGSSARAKYAQEQANWLPVIQEINDLGSELGIRQIGLGNLRG